MSSVVEQSLLVQLPNEPPSDFATVLSIIRDLRYHFFSFPLPLIDDEVFGFDNATSSGTDTFKATTAHSQYNAPGFNTSLGITSGTWVDCTGMLNGVGRKRACSTDCIAISWDLKKIRRTGCRMTYIRTIRTYRAAMQTNSQSYSERCRTYCR
jgi:hypothetical protein